MPKHEILDRSGHTTWEFDTADKISVAEAMQRFDELNAKGYAAVVPSGDGTPGKLVREFDPEADMQFIPALQGG